VDLNGVKFRMGLEQPSTKIFARQSGNNRGTISNSYLGIHLGFFVGGGKWGK
jgi:outer membrane protein X